MEVYDEKPIHKLYIPVILNIYCVELMTKFQLIDENDLKTHCCYCNSKLKDWKSEFLTNTHYKTCVCSCGKKVSVKVDFMGSGHDEWENEEESDIEQIVNSKE